MKIMESYILGRSELGKWKINSCMTRQFKNMQQAKYKVLF